MDILLVYVQENKETVYEKFGTEDVVEAACICLDPHLLDVEMYYERIKQEDIPQQHSRLLQKINRSDVLVFWDQEMRRKLSRISYYYNYDLANKRTVILKDHISRLRTYENDTFSSILWKHGIFYDVRRQADAEYNVNCLKRLYRLVAMQYRQAEEIDLVYPKTDKKMYRSRCKSMKNIDKKKLFKGKPLNLLTGWKICDECREYIKNELWPARITEYEILKKGFMLTDLYMCMIEDAFGLTCTFERNIIKIQTQRAMWEIILDGNIVHEISYRYKSTKPGWTNRKQIVDHIADNPFIVIAHIANQDQQYYERMNFPIADVLSLRGNSMKISG